MDSEVTRSNLSNFSKLTEGQKENLSRLLTTNGLLPAFIEEEVYPANPFPGSEEWKLGWVHYEWALLFHTCSRVRILAPRDHLKCLEGNSLILMANGERKKIQDIILGEYVLSIDSNLKIISSEVLRVHKDVGNKKTIFRLKTRSGRVVESSQDHKFLTFEGWKSLNQLKQGEYIAVPRRYNLNSIGISKEIARFLGYMIGDGSCTSGCVFTNMDVEILEDFQNICKKYGYAFRKKGETIGYGISSESGRIINSPLNLLRKFNLEGKNSYTKRVPKEIFESSKETIASFLKSYFSCDGSVNKYRNYIYVASVSYELLQDIQHLLLRFDIISYIRPVKTKCNDKLFRSYDLMIYSIDSIRKFYTDIGFVGKKKKQLLSRIKWTNKRKGNPQSDVIPKQWRSVLKNTTWWFREKHNIRIDNDYDTSREKVLKTAQIEGNQNLIDLATSDIFWDKVEDIQNTKKEELMYDLTINGTGNFIANDIFVHNSSLAILWVAFRLKQVQGGEVYYVSKNAKLAIRRLKALKTLIENVPSLRYLKGEVWKETAIETSQGTSVFAQGYDSAFRGEHPFLIVCLPAGEEVFTQTGLKKIEDINLKDSIYSHSGKSRSISKLYEREFSGNICGISIYGNPDSIKCTDNHKILAIKPEECQIYKDKKCYPNCETQRCQKVNWKKKKYEISWIAAKELEKGDVVVFPIDKREPGRLSVLNSIGEAGQAKSIISKRDIKGKILDAQRTIKRYTKKDKYFLWDESFWRFVGYWIAEGSLAKSGEGYHINLAFNKKEIDLIEDVHVIIKKIFNSKISVVVRNNAANLQMCCRRLYYFLKMFHKEKNGGSWIKVLPEWVVYMPYKYLKQLVKGYYFGDGCVINSKGKAEYKIISISKELLYQIQRILYRLGVVSTIRFLKRKEIKTEIAGVSCISKISYDLRMGIDFSRIIDEEYKEDRKKKNRSRKWIRDNYVFSEIRELKVTPYQGKVYNLEVEKDNSYCGKNVVFHNCDDVIDIQVIYSKDHNDKTKARWLAEFLPMAEPKNEDLYKTTQFIVLGTIQREDDLYSMMKSPKWELRTYDSIVDEERQITLFPEKWNWEQLMDRKAECLADPERGEKFWKKEYRNDATAMRGSIFNSDWFKYSAVTPMDMAYYCGWDLSVAKTRSHSKLEEEKILSGDYTAGVTIGVNADGDIYVVDAIRGRWSLQERLNNIERMANRWNPQLIVIEDNAFQEDTVQMAIRKLRYSIKGETSTKDKIQKAHANSIMFQNGKVIFICLGYDENNIPIISQDMSALRSELINFPGNYDDFVDALDKSFIASRYGQTYGQGSFTEKQMYDKISEIKAPSIFLTEGISKFQKIF